MRRDGKDVFAIPDSIHSAQSKDCHALIKQGAKLVESAQDVLEELRAVQAAAPITSAAGQVEQCLQSMTEHLIILAMGFDPISIGVLQARVDIDAATLQVQLLELETETSHPLARRALSGGAVTQ